MTDTAKQHLEEIFSQIETGVQDLFQPEKYQQYLSTMSRFHNYSINNQTLIHMQRPNASLVASFNKWKKEFGRHVMRGEKGIRILAPIIIKKKEAGKTEADQTPVPATPDEKPETYVAGFTAVSVFDISQTDGAQDPADQHDHLYSRTG